MPLPHSAGALTWAVFGVPTFLTCAPAVLSFVLRLPLSRPHTHSLPSSLSLSLSLSLSRTRTRSHTHTHTHTLPTGVDFYSKALKVDDRIISLQLWDTAGQERFQSVTKAYYRGAQGVILMYDITQEESFIAVKSWINSIQV